MTGDLTAAEIAAAYEPEAVPTETWDEIGEFTRAAVLAATDSPSRVRLLLVTVSRYVAWQRSKGTKLTRPSMFMPDMIHHFIKVGALDIGLTDKSRATYRERLMQVSAAVVPELQPRRPETIPYKNVSTPYSEAERAGFELAADNQPTASMRRKVSAVVCLGFGCGMVGSDQSRIRPEHVRQLGNGLVVVSVVGGKNPRTVPLLPRYERRLLDHVVAHTRDGEPLVGGSSAREASKVWQIVDEFRGSGELPKLNGGRMRSTWMAEVMSAPVPLAALMRMAGTKTLRSYEELIGDLPAGGDEVWWQAVREALL